MKKIVKIVIVVFTFLLLLNNVSAQNRVFPGKYDFKPMIKLYASSGNCDYGEFYSIHEAYYNKGNDKARSITETSVLPVGEDVKELRWILERMLEALDKPVLDYEDF